MSAPKKTTVSRRSILAAGSASLLGAIAMPTFAGISSAYAASVGGRKMLIIYYSWGGNTRHMAERIRFVTEADIVELKTVTPYPKEYRPTTEQARRELNSGYRPPLVGTVPNLADYDTIFIGSPNWWGTLAMPFFTFLEANNLAGKTLVPFITHEGSAFGRALTDLKALCPNATIVEGLAVRGGRVQSAQTEIAQWLQKIGMAR